MNHKAKAERLLAEITDLDLSAKAAAAHAARAAAHATLHLADVVAAGNCAPRDVVRDS